ncbi:MAG: replication-associated recombination protein A [Patescibacteria group bacterium]|nr:replication-associated recombination protein A [Patescibacteria group bacterium]
MSFPMDLFDFQSAKRKTKEAPLADRMRAASFAEFVGQEDVVGEGSALRKLIERDEVPSMIFWGPPGTGKTTLARLIARLTKSRFVPMSAVSSGVADLRQTVAEAQETLKFSGVRTIVFIDEIHRWNKAQQDAFLPYVEDGTVILIGATTENPSFEVNSALLSRSRVFVLKKLDTSDIEALLRRALADKERGYGNLKIEAEEGVIEFIAGAADGDARSALNALEMAVKSAQPAGAADANAVIQLKRAELSAILKRSHLLYDRKGEEHYNIISALHKSLRGSNADAALYWLGRMLEAGEDPLYVARRLVRFASEDVGLADPQALVQANAAFQATHALGMPECNVHLAQAVVYLARAPKSNALYVAYGKVKADIDAAPNEPVPLHLRNAPTKLMKELEYGKGYVYAHNVKERRADGHADDRQEYFPEKLKGRKYL